MEKHVGSSQSSIELILGVIQAELEHPASDLTLEAALVDDLHLDSLALLSVIARIEEEIGREWREVGSINLATATIRDLVAVLP